MASCLSTDRPHTHMKSSVAEAAINCPNASAVSQLPLVLSHTTTQSQTMAIVRYGHARPRNTTRQRRSFCHPNVYRRPRNLSKWSSGRRRVGRVTWLCPHGISRRLVEKQSGNSLDLIDAAVSSHTFKPSHSTGLDRPPGAFCKVLVPAMSLFEPPSCQDLFHNTGC